jgi:ABC-type lipoprotein release transport system permease subunit
LLGALAAGQLLSGLLFGISPWDAGTYAGALSVLSLAALLATVIPAIRTTTIAPVAALQQ